MLNSCQRADTKRSRSATLTEVACASRAFHLLLELGHAALHHQCGSVGHEGGVDVDVPSVGRQRLRQNRSLRLKSISHSDLIPKRQKEFQVPSWPFYGAAILLCRKKTLVPLP